MILHIRIAIACALLLLTSLYLNAQTITWQRTYGSLIDEQGSTISQTFDGGYIFAGVRAAVGTFVIRTNSTGDTLWSRIINDGNPTRIRQLKDSNYLIIGHARGASGFHTDGFAVKINDKGNILWSRLYGGGLPDHLQGLYEFQDRTLLFAGTTVVSFNPDRINYFIIKTNADGDTLWNKSFDSTGVLSALEPVPGIGFLLSGAMAVLIDSSGSKISSNRLLPGIGIYAADHNGFLFMNRRDSIRIGISLIRTDMNFVQIWESFIHDSDMSLYGYSVIRVGLSYVVTGQAITPTGETGLFICKTDLFGNIGWQREYFKNKHYNSGAKEVALCQDNGFVLIGQSKPYFGQLDIAVSKTDSNGLFNTTDIKNETKISTRTLTMSQNYPNPFNAQTKIFFSIAINSDIVFRVFDNSGKLVNEMRLGTMSAGNHTISLCKLNLASGVYFYCFLASNSEANEVVTRKFVLLK